MIALSLGEAAQAMGGILHGDDRRFLGVSTDTRTLTRGQLFFALRGPNFDGHDMAAKAVIAGAVAAVVEQASRAVGAQIVVANTRRALGKLARYWRERFELPVLAITGSAGKTTVKEMLGAIARNCGPALVTRGNLNNDIGVPLTLFQLAPQHRHAVIEMGANQAGDIATLVEITRPSVGVITLCAPAHLEGFGDVETVARTKGEMVAGLDPDGVAVINHNDNFTALWRQMSGAKRVLSFGDGGDVSATEISHSADHTRFELHSAPCHFSVTLSYIGRHNVNNALAAATAAIAAGIDGQVIKQGLAQARPIVGRLQISDGVSGSTIIDDSYNANPASVAAAIEVLAASAAGKWLIIGDMGELGSRGPELHRDVGCAARAAGIDRLFAIGELSQAAVEAFGPNAEHFSEQVHLISRVQSLLGEAGESVTVLIKGSRFMGMERIVHALRDEAGASC